MQGKTGLCLSIWLVLTAVSLTVACGLSPAETATTPTPEPPRTVATQAVQTTPAPTARLGKLAFVKGGDIWVKDLPDGEAKRLTQDGRNGQPLWSPSGDRLAFQKELGPDGMELRRTAVAGIRLLRRL